MGWLINFPPDSQNKYYNTVSITQATLIGTIFNIFSYWLSLLQPYIKNSPRLKDSLVMQGYRVGTVKNDCEFDTILSHMQNFTSLVSLSY